VLKIWGMDPTLQSMYATHEMLPVNLWCHSQDNETLLEYLLQRGEESRALAVLRQPNISHELIYKFAPVRLTPFTPAFDHVRRFCLIVVGPH
jgi:hypothetical protein